jgi:hypothetical protein
VRWCFLPGSPVRRGETFVLRTRGLPNGYVPPSTGGLVEVVSVPVVSVPYPVDAQHPPTDFDG